MIATPSATDRSARRPWHLMASHGICGASWRDPPGWWFMALRGVSSGSWTLGSVNVAHSHLTQPHFQHGRCILCMVPQHNAPRCIKIGISYQRQQQQQHPILTRDGSFPPPTFVSGASHHAQNMGKQIRTQRTQTDRLLKQSPSPGGPAAGRPPRSRPCP